MNTFWVLHLQMSLKHWIAVTIQHCSLFQSRLTALQLCDTQHIFYYPAKWCAFSTVLLLHDCCHLKLCHLSACSVYTHDHTPLYSFSLLSATWNSAISVHVLCTHMTIHPFTVSHYSVPLETAAISVHVLCTHMTIHPFTVSHYSVPLETAAISVHVLCTHMTIHPFTVSHYSVPLETAAISVHVLCTHMTIHPFTVSHYSMPRTKGGCVLSHNPPPELFSLWWAVLRATAVRQVQQTGK